MQKFLIDFILILVLIYLIILVSNNYKCEEDYDNYLIDSFENKVEQPKIESSKVEKSTMESSKIEKPKIESSKIEKPTMESSKIEKNKLLSNKEITKFINELYDRPIIDINGKHINDNVSLKNDSYKILKNESRVNDRYNRKYNNIPTESELYNIRKFDLDNLIDEENVENNNIINKFKYNTVLKHSNDIDTKIYNKNNKSQKLFKDTKTIAARFTKNSIIDDYKNELDYYQKLRTPWWEENIE